MTVKDLAKRVDQIPTRQWNPSQEEIIASFVNTLPREIRDQVIQYARHMAKLEAGERDDENAESNQQG